MNLIVNGEGVEVGAGLTIETLLVSIGLSEDKVMACAVDGVVVKKAEWCSTVLAENQKVELLNFVGGG